jgi:hypothetical protein
MDEDFENEKNIIYEMFNLILSLIEEFTKEMKEMTFKEYKFI